jgi:hypothetical protein
MFENRMQYHLFLSLRSKAPSLSILTSSAWVAAMKGLHVLLRSGLFYTAGNNQNVLHGSTVRVFCRPHLWS